MCMYVEKGQQHKGFASDLDQLIHPSRKWPRERKIADFVAIRVENRRLATVIVFNVPRKGSWYDSSSVWIKAEKNLARTHGLSGRHLKRLVLALIHIIDGRSPSLIRTRTISCIWRNRHSSMSC